MKRLGQWLSILMGAGMLLAACAPKAGPTPTPTPSPTQQPVPTPSAAPATQPAGWDAVLAAAKKEGTVTMYTTWGSLTTDAMKAAMRQYGIKVETISGTGADLELKVATEQRAKAYSTDLFLGGWTNQVTIAQQGFAQQLPASLPALAEKGVWKTDPAKYYSEKMVYISGTSVSVSVIINTDLVGNNEVQGWQDLVDPKWRDRIVMSDPRTGSGPGAAGMAVWTPLGDDYWKKMAAQRPTLQVSYDIPVQQVAHGEKYVAIFPAWSRVLPAIQAGAPIKIVNMKEGSIYSLNGAVMVKNSPHPNASMVLLNWLFTRDGQIAVGKSLGNMSVRNDIVENWLGVPELNPKNFTLREPASNLDPSTSLQAADYAKKIFGAR